MEDQSSLFAVIPAAVMRDKRLRANAKLLYGEITALARKGGYCWAENSHFAEVLGVSAKTVSELIGQLQKCGHIQVEVQRDDQSHVVLSRRLWIIGTLGTEPIPAPETADPSPEKSGDLPRKLGGPPPKNRGTSPEKSGGFNKEEIYKEIYKENTPKAPTGGSARNHVRGYKEKADWLPERFEAFWAWYRTHVRPENKQAALRAWDKLQPDDALIRRIGQALTAQIESREWQEGIGKPHASTYLNEHRWEDAENLPQPRSEQGRREETSWGWA